MATYTPRFGVSASEDKTGRIVTYGYNEVAYATPTAVIPNDSETTYLIGQLTGALTLTATVTAAKVGDKVIFLFSADGTNRVVTFSTGFATAGTLTVVASKKGSATFVFDGVAFVEVARALTA